MSRFIQPLESVYDLNGRPIAGAQMFFYEVGTVTEKNTYSDEALTIPNANPVIADGSGRFSSIYLSGDYDVVLRDAEGVLIYGPEKASSFLNNLSKTTKRTTLSDLVADDLVSVGDSFIVSDRANAIFEAKTGLTANGYDIIQSSADAGIQFELESPLSVCSAYFGATAGALQAAIDYAILNGFLVADVSADYTITNLTGLDEVRLASSTGATLTIGGDSFNVPYEHSTTAPIELFVASDGSDSDNCGLSSSTAFATIQQALEFLPINIGHDVVINIADGTYDDINGVEEFGRPVCVDVSRKTISTIRDPSAALNEKKAKLIFRGESEAGTIVDGTNSTNARYGFWIHEVQGVQLENITVTNCYIGVISHQNADVTIRDVTTSGCDFGRMIESNSRLEVLRGSNGTALNPNVRNYFIKNGQLQENDSVQAPATENGFLIDGEAWVYCLRVDIEGTSGKNTIDSSGSTWFEFEDCDIYTGNNFVVGTYSEMKISNGTRLHDFSSAVWANEAGYTQTDGLCHIHDNAFIAFITKGVPVFNLDNCDSLNESLVDEPNTNGLRIQGGATSVLLDPDCSTTGAEVLSRPSSGLLMKATAAPAIVTTYYERGALVLNEAAAIGQPQGWICTTAGYGGVAVFTAMPNL